MLGGLGCMAGARCWLREAATCLLLYALCYCAGCATICSLCLAAAPVFIMSNLPHCVQTIADGTCCLLLSADILQAVRRAAASAWQLHLRAACPTCLTVCKQVLTDATCWLLLFAAFLQFV
jgi:hypothetical protein